MNEQFRKALQEALETIEQSKSYLWLNHSKSFDNGGHIVLIIKDFKVQKFSVFLKTRKEIEQ